MMRRRGGFRRHIEVAKGGDPRKTGFQVAELAYKGGELSLVLLVLARHDGLPALEAKLTADALAGWLAKAEDGKDVDLYLPKFRIETAPMALAEPLRKLGMAAAFDPAAADLTGMHAGDERLYVGAVTQKAFVDVAEDGTEAVAATVVESRVTGGRFPVRADRPFLFLIRDARRGTILFLGRVQKP